MKQKTGILAMLLVFTSCFFNDYKGEHIISSTENFSINATVNRTDKKANNYADVVIHLFDKKGIKISELNSEAGDFSKWTIGWTKTGDTIVIQSSDIGNKSLIIKNNQLVQIKTTESINERAEWLKSKKYD